MDALRCIADRYLRIDARSLGLFRILFGLTLIGDLIVRWSWRIAFYTNDGVLPNHNHLFQLRETGRVWSVYHAFSNEDELLVAFALTLVFYAFFTLGWYTRAFAVVSAVCLVSLSGRNVLLDGPGDALAICLALAAMFLPLGARYSIDSLRRRMAARDEHDAAELNDRGPPPEEPRPTLAALAILLVAAGVPLLSAVQQRGASWQDGQALYYALRTDRWTSALGEAARHAPLGVLTAWAKLYKLCEWAALPLALVPTLRTVTRPLAMAALAVIGLTYAAFFSFGPYGWSLLAAVPLLAPPELWALRKPGNRKITLFYDEDCGICLWLARLLKRLDGRQNVTFAGNSVFGSSPDGSSRGAVDQLPEGITAEMAERSMIAVGPDGKAHRDAEALAEVLRSLPLAGLGLGWIVALPGFKQLTRALYYRVAENRMAISEACGLGACGLPRPEEHEPPPPPRESPAKRWHRAVAATVEGVFVAALLAVIAAQTEDASGGMLHTGIERHPRVDDKLLAAASWARITAPWDLWVPEPPRRNEALVTEATVREGARDAYDVDVLNGYPPDVELKEPARHRLGALWATYGELVRRDEFTSFRQELRRYLMRGGAVADASDKPVPIGKLKVFWVSAPIPAPGEAPTGLVERTELYDYNPGQRLPDFAAGLRPAPIHTPRPR